MGEWYDNIGESILRFTLNQESEKKPGYFKYTCTSDLYDENNSFGVGAAVYALKILYTLNYQNKERITNAVRNILKYAGERYIYDPLVYRKYFLRNILSSLRHKKFHNFLNVEYKRAETRQAVSIINKVSDLNYYDNNLPCFYTENEFNSFTNSLNWRKPWAAGSHLSHYMYYNQHNYNTGNINKENYDFFNKE